MRDRFLLLLYRLSARGSRPVLAISVAATVLLGLFVPFLEVSNSHSDLVPTSHPEQRAYLDFLEEFGAADNMVVVLDGNPEALKASAEVFAREIRAEKAFVRSVFYRVDLDLLLKNAPLLMPEEALRQAHRFLATNAATVRALAAVDSLPALLDTAGQGLSGNLPGFDLAPVHAPRALAGIRAFFRQWQNSIDEPSSNPVDHVALLETVGIGKDEISLVRTQGYLLSRDETMLFLFVQPLAPDTDASYLRPLQEALRAACERALDCRPELRDEIKVAFTGMPAHLLAEVETIGSDVGRASAISVFLVIAILLLGFRSPKTMLLTVAPLACGMIMTLGAVVLTVGRLNLVSSSFLAVLFGIGIDFAIYLVRRVEEELGNGRTREEAVRISVTVSGKGVLTGGLSTSLAFFAEGSCDFVGFSELGITAGIGVLVVMATTFLMLPALLLHVPIKPRVYDLSQTTDEEWLRHERHLLYPLVGLAAILAAIGLYAIPRLSFDFNALHLLPPDSESTVYQLRMQDESDFQMTFAAVTAGNLEELRGMEERMHQLPTVSRIDSLTRLVPSDQDAKVALLRQCNRLLPDTQFEPDSQDRNRVDYVGALDRVTDRFEQVQEKAFAAGQAAIVAEVDKTLSIMSSIRDSLSAEDVAVERTRAFETALFGKLAGLGKLVRRWPELTPLGPDSYPAGMVNRFRSKKGRYVAYVFPNGPVWDLDFLDRFVADLHTVTDNVTGFPTTVPVHTRMAVNGLRQSLAYGLVIILVLLAFDFKRIRPVLLSLVPLVVGMLWVQAAFYFMGRDYNYASMAGLPLLLGLGIVYGVHIVHRWQENTHLTAFAATMTSGRGVAFAALTTMAGLVSIVFARHRGVSDFGTVILLGISACLAASLVVLPAVIDLLYLRPGRKKENDDGE